MQAAEIQFLLLLILWRLFPIARFNHLTYIITDNADFFIVIINYIVKK